MTKEYFFKQFEWHFLSLVHGKWRQFSKNDNRNVDPSDYKTSVQNLLKIEGLNILLQWCIIHMELLKQVAPTCKKTYNIYDLTFEGC